MTSRDMTAMPDAVTGLKFVYSARDDLSAPEVTFRRDGSDVTVYMTQGDSFLLDTGKAYTSALIFVLLLGVC